MYFIIVKTTAFKFNTDQKKKNRLMQLLSKCGTHHNMIQRCKPNPSTNLQNW